MNIHLIMFILYLVSIVISLFSYIYLIWEEGSNITVELLFVMTVTSVIPLLNLLVMLGLIAEKYKDQLCNFTDKIVIKGKKK